MPLSPSDGLGFLLSLTDNLMKLSTCARFLEAELPSPCRETTAQYRSDLDRGIVSQEQNGYVELFVTAALLTLAQIGL